MQAESGKGDANWALDKVLADSYTEGKCVGRRYQFNAAPNAGHLIAQNGKKRKEPLLVTVECWCYCKVNIAEEIATDAGVQHRAAKRDGWRQSASAGEPEK